MKFNRSEFVINIDSVRYNLNQIKRILSDNVGIMPVLKTNSYGTNLHINYNVLLDAGIKIIAVAFIEEGIYLREIGYMGDLLILNQPFVNEIEYLFRYDLIPSVNSSNFIYELDLYSKLNNKNICVHLEIETGMNRSGIKLNQLNLFLSKSLSLNNIVIEGIFTHFSSSTSDYDFTKKQISIFNSSIKILRNKIKKVKYIHACNSGAILNFPEAHYNLVRPGIMLYGYLPKSELENKIKLKPALMLTSKISYIKSINVGESVGYNRAFIASVPMIIATIPFGFADGLFGYESDNSYVLINGKLAKNVAICMDNIMVDISNIVDVEIGSQVFFWDNVNITLDDVARWCRTSNYEVLSTISDRVIRKFI